MLAKSGCCPAAEGTYVYSRAPQEQRAAEGPAEGTRSTEARLSHKEQEGTGLVAAALGGHCFFRPTWRWHSP